MEYSIKTHDPEVFQAIIRHRDEVYEGYLRGVVISGLTAWYEAYHIGTPLKVVEQHGGMWNHLDLGYTITSTSPTYTFVFVRRSLHPIELLVVLMHEFAHASLHGLGLVRVDHGEMWYEEARKLWKKLIRDFPPVLQHLRNVYNIRLEHHISVSQYMARLEI